ncbi:MAG: hypothetical protein KAS32_05915 [Candidatus Peribacteraceae bacterium]|nr:hypothetical protein [Candidatus Peribacteraceae bacterium]
MKLEDQVCSLELSQKLKELGVKQESRYVWVDLADPRQSYGSMYKLKSSSTGWNKPFSAFTVAELGEMLELYLHKSWKNANDNWMCSCLVDEKVDDENTYSKEIFEEAKTEADARAKMLIYLIENKLIEGSNA